MRKEFFTKTRFYYQMKELTSHKEHVLKKLNQDLNHGADKNEGFYPEPKNRSFSQRMSDMKSSLNNTDNQE